MKQMSKKKKIIAASISLAALAGAITPVTLAVIKNVPNFIEPESKKDTDTFKVTKRQINDYGQLEITYRATDDKKEVNSAKSITKGGVELKEYIESDSIKASVFNANNVNIDDIDGDYYFDKASQTFVIFEKTLRNIPGDIAIVPEIINKSFSCTIDTFNIDYGNKSKKYLIRSWKDGEEIPIDTDVPVYFYMQGDSVNHASVITDSEGRPNLQVFDETYFGPIKLVAKRDNHLDFEMEFEVGSFDKLDFVNNPNNENEVYLTRKKDVDEIKGTIAVPYRYYDESAKKWKNVTGIADDAFNGSTETFLNFKFHTSSDSEGENKITYVGNSAFANCSKLSGLNLYDVTANSVGSNLFENCTSLGSLTTKLPQNVTTISNSCFKNCKGSSFKDLTSILNSNIANIDKEAFYNCTSVNELSILNSISTIGESAFACASGVQGSINKISFESDGSQERTFTCGKNAFLNQKIKTIICDSAAVCNSTSFKVDSESDGNSSNLFDSNPNEIYLNTSLMKKTTDTSKQWFTINSDSYFARYYEDTSEKYDDKGRNIDQFRLSEYLQFNKYNGSNSQCTVSYRQNNKTGYYPSNIVIPQTYHLVDFYNDLGGGAGQIYNVTIVGFDNNAFASDATSNDQGKHANLVSLDISNNSNISTLPTGMLKGQTNFSTIKLYNGKKYTVQGEAFSGCTSFDDNTIFSQITKLEGAECFNKTGIKSINLKNLNSSGAMTDSGPLKGMYNLTSINNISLPGTIKKGTFDIALDGDETYKGKVNTVTLNTPKKIESIFEKDVFKDFATEEGTVNLSGDYQYWTLDDKTDESELQFFNSALIGKSTTAGYPTSAWDTIKNHKMQWRKPSQSISINVKGSYTSTSGTTMVDHDKTYSWAVSMSGGSTFEGEVGYNKGYTYTISNNCTDKKNGSIYFGSKNATVTITAVSKDNPNLSATKTIGVANNSDGSIEKDSLECSPKTNDTSTLDLSYYQWEKVPRWYWYRRAGHTTENNTSTFTIKLTDNYVKKGTKLDLSIENRGWGLLHSDDFTFGNYRGKSGATTTMTKVLEDNSKSFTVRVYLVGTTCGTLDLVVRNNGREIYRLRMHAG